jgi:hypothetical protein
MQKGGCKSRAIINNAGAAGLTARLGKLPSSTHMPAWQAHNDPHLGGFA